MQITLTKYQSEFRAKLPAEDQTNFDDVVKVATDAADVAAFIKALPEGFEPIMKGVATIESALDKVFSNSAWPESVGEYVAPKATLPKKTLAAKPAPKATVAPAAGAAPAEGSKRRGNPEALRKAREAKGTKTPEEVAADKAVVMAGMVAHLTANAGPQGIKPTILALVEQLKGKGTKAADLSESFIYSTVTAAVKDDSCPFKFAEMEGKKKGYTLK